MSLELVVISTVALWPLQTTARTDWCLMSLYVLRGHVLFTLHPKIQLRPGL